MIETIIKYFDSLNIEVTQSLEREFLQFQKKNYSSGELFHREGSICNKIGFIASGKVRHYYNIDGKDMTRWVSLPNTFMTSFASFVSEQPSLDNLECIEDSCIYVTNKEHFDHVKAKFPEINLVWTKALEQEMIGYEYRVYQLITKDAEKRYLDLQEKYPTLIQEVPQKYLASMLGIEPRHLSRIRKKLSQKS